MAVTYFSTARTLTTMASAIAWFESPRAIRPSASLSRGVRRVSDGRVERRAPVAHPADGGGELGDVGDAVLQEVADTVDALGEQLGRQPDLDVLGEHEDAHERPPPPDLPGRPQPLVGEGRRQADVDHDDVGRDLVGAAEKRGRVVVGADHVDAGVVEEADESGPQEHRVLGQCDPQNVSGHPADRGFGGSVPVSSQPPAARSLEPAGCHGARGKTGARSRRRPSRGSEIR